MPLVAAAVCPHPPALVPAVAPAAAADLAELRAACAAAVDGLPATDAQLVVVGADATTRWLDPPYGGSFGQWGEPAVVVGTGDAGLPLSLLVGAWLLGGAQPARMLAVASHEAPAGCLELGARLAAGGPVALLVMGDGAARRGEKAPGYLDPRAEAFDAAVARSLGTADLRALAGLDPVLAAELLAAGRAPWQVLAGAAGGRPWRAELRYADAPYGVGYFVASWSSWS